MTLVLIAVGCSWTTRKCPICALYARLLELLARPL